MQPEKTLILDHQAVLTKLERMACEICEKHYHDGELVLCGLNSRGYFLAVLLREKISQVLPKLTCTLINARVQEGGVAFDVPVSFRDKHVLVMDDVINTGATLMLVLSRIFGEHPKSIATAFLAKREHRYFPVKADYVGVSLATTLQEHVQFDNSDPANLNVFLN